MVAMMPCDLSTDTWHARTKCSPEGVYQAQYIRVLAGGNAHRFNLSHFFLRGRAPIPKPARKIIEVRVVGSKIAS